MRNKFLLRVIGVVGFGLLTASSVPAQPSARVDSQTEDANAKPCVVVYGAVRSPLRLRLDRPRRLSQAIAMAGGVNQEATGTVKVIHLTDLNCEQQLQVTARCIDCLTTTQQPPAMDLYQLSQLPSDDEKANPYLQPGDRVLVVELVTVYVVGNVSAPQGIHFETKPTLTQAIAIAGGMLRDSNMKRIRIFRSKSDSTREEIIVDFNAIKKGRAEDVLLQPFDIIEVPSKRGGAQPNASVIFDQRQVPSRLII
jgi:protein involved in polysaccharide export with SLBB domain